MKTNTTNQKKRRIAALAILLLLAICVGGYYINDQRSLNKGGVDDASMALNTPTPVVTDAGTPAVAQVDNANQEASEYTPVAAKASVAGRSVRSRYRSSKKISNTENIAIATSNGYEGNMLQATPTFASEKTSTPEQNKVATVTYKTEARFSGKHRSSGAVNIAPEIGGNLNGFYNNNTANLLTSTFHAGLMVNIRLGNDIALQPGLRYIQKGNEDKSTASSSEFADVNTTRIMKLQYMELPVNFVYKFGDKLGNPRFMIGAGPYISYLVNAKDKIVSTADNVEGNTVTTNNYTANTTTSMKKLDYGVGGFIGCQMPKGFYAAAGTEWGFRNIDQDPITGKAADRNYNFLISVGYILGSKNKVY